MARRTGVPSLIDAARGMCKLILLFSPTIRRIYADRPLLIAALETANEACMQLEIQLELVREIGD